VESRLLEFLKRKNGAAHETNGGEGDSDGEDGGGKPHAEAKVGLVGNVTRGKVEMMTPDFDLLFGAEGTGSGDEAVPDLRPSSGGVNL
jgi:hypothetical protein